MRADGKTTQRKEKGGERGRGMGTEFYLKKKEEMEDEQQEKTSVCTRQTYSCCLEKKGQFLSSHKLLTNFLRITGWAKKHCNLSLSHLSPRVPPAK